VLWLHHLYHLQGYAQVNDNIYEKIVKILIITTFFSTKMTLELRNSGKQAQEVSSTFADTVTGPSVSVLKGDQSTTPWEIISSLLE